METRLPKWTAADEALFYDVKHKRPTLYKELRKWVIRHASKFEDKIQKFRENIDAHVGFIEGDLYADYNIREVCPIYNQCLRFCTRDQIIQTDARLYCENTTPASGFYPSIDWSISYCCAYAVIKSIVPDSRPFFVHERSENEEMICHFLLEESGKVPSDMREEIVKLVEESLETDIPKTESRDFSLNDQKVSDEERPEISNGDNLGNKAKSEDANKKRLIIDAIKNLFNEVDNKTKANMAEIFLERVNHECVENKDVLKLVREFVDRKIINEANAVWSKMGDKLRLYKIYDVPDYDKMTETQKKSIRTNWNTGVKVQNYKRT